MDYRRLPEILKRKGCEFVRVYTDESYYIYEQFTELEGIKQSVAFEVWKRRTVKPHPNDSDQSMKESFPTFPMLQ